LISQISGNKAIDNPRPVGHDDERIRVSVTEAGNTASDEVYVCHTQHDEPQYSHSPCKADRGMRVLTRPGKRLPPVPLPTRTKAKAKTLRSEKNVATSPVTEQNCKPLPRPVHTP
jgi:hypothetical protein